MKASHDRLVLVTGGGGYIGSVLIPQLLAQGYRVRVIDSFLYKNKQILASFAGHESFQLVTGSITDSALIKEAVKGCTDIIHLAALVGDPICKKYPEEAKLVNLTSSLDLITQAQESGITRFIFVSTCSNYGLRETDDLATENAPLNPISLYAETKVAVEQHLLENKDKSNFSPTVLRLATAHGLSPRMRFDLTVSEFTRQLQTGEKLSVYDYNTWRPYCHVEDITTAIIKVLEADRKLIKSQVFNVGDNGQHYTKKQLVETIRNVLCQGEVEYVQGSVDPRNYRVSFDHIRAQLGFTIKRTVAQSIGHLKHQFDRGAFADYHRRLRFYRNQEIDIN